MRSVEKLGMPVRFFTGTADVHGSLKSSSRFLFVTDTTVSRLTI